MALPKELFITHEHPEDYGGFYGANLTAEDAISGSDESTPVVGTYRLVEENRLELISTTRVKKVKTKK